MSFCFASLCLADAPRASEVTVTGQGEVMVKPTEMIVSAEVAGQAELASDALAKFKDAKRRALATPEELKLPGLTVEARGVAFWGGQMVQANGGEQLDGGEGAPPMKTSVRAVERVRWVMKEIDKLPPEQVLEAMAKLSDAIHDLGMTSTNEQAGMVDSDVGGDVGQPASMFLFRVPDPEPAREKARKLAMEDATTRAGKIVAQAGGKLGRIVTIKEDRFDLNGAAQYYEADDEQGQHAQRNAMTEVPVRAQVTMTFEFTPGEVKAAEK